MKNQVLVISHDVVGQRMAGPGIRYWEIAHTIAARQPVTLIAPQPIDQSSSVVRCGSYSWGDPLSLANWLAEADVVVANGFILLAHPELANIAQPLALDLYDPTLLENLELFRDASEEQRKAQNEQDIELLNRQLRAGDFFLCATERQRDLYIGALMAAGRITPVSTDNDPELRRLIDVVPFGLPSEAPVKTRPVLRGVIPGVEADDLIVLWTGGIWDWMDPLTLIRAMPGVVEREPRVRLIFLAGRHPGNIQEMKLPQEAKAMAASLGLLNTHIFFYEHWIPYTERADFLLEADIAISLHQNSLESRYAAVRSRFLDHLWAGLPSIVSDGDSAAELVRTYDLGRVVTPQDHDQLARAMLDLLNDEDSRKQCAERAARLASTWQWEVVLAPLMWWVESAPTRKRNAMEKESAFTVSEKPEQQEVAEISIPSSLDSLIALAREAEQLWELFPGDSRNESLHPCAVIRSAVQKANAAIYHRQTQFNSVMIRVLYLMLEEITRLENLTEFHQETRTMLQNLMEAHGETRMMLQNLMEAHGETRMMLQNLMEAHHITRDSLRIVNERLADEEVASTQFAQKISKLL